MDEVGHDGADSLLLYNEAVQLLLVVVQQRPQLGQRHVTHVHAFVGDAARQESDLPFQALNSDRYSKVQGESLTEEPNEHHRFLKINWSSTSA